MNNYPKLNQKISQPGQIHPRRLFTQRKTRNEKMIKTWVIIIFFFSILLLTVHILRNIADENYRKRGELLIDKIEAFRKLEKRLPNNVNELGLEEPMNAGPYYGKKDSINYVVYFTIGFDGVFIYCSNTKEWKDDVSILSCPPINNPGIS